MTHEQSCYCDEFRYLTVTECPKCGKIYHNRCLQAKFWEKKQDIYCKSPLKQPSYDEAYKCPNKDCNRYFPKDGDYSSRLTIGWSDPRYAYSMIVIFGLIINVIVLCILYWQFVYEPYSTTIRNVYSKVREQQIQYGFEKHDYDKTLSLNVNSVIGTFVSLMGCMMCFFILELLETKIRFIWIFTMSLPYIAIIACTYYLLFVAYCDIRNLPNKVDSIHLLDYNYVMDTSFNMYQHGLFNSTYTERDYTNEFYTEASRNVTLLLSYQEDAYEYDASLGTMFYMIGILNCMMCCVWSIAYGPSDTNLNGKKTTSDQKMTVSTV
jgi:hypothetical protein